jgi:hypothetical protein
VSEHGRTELELTKKLSHSGSARCYHLPRGQASLSQTCCRPEDSGETVFTVVRDYTRCRRCGEFDSHRVYGMERPLKGYPVSLQVPTEDLRDSLVVKKSFDFVRDFKLVVHNTGTGSGVTLRVRDAGQHRPRRQG